MRWISNRRILGALRMYVTIRDVDRVCRSGCASQLELLSAEDIVEFFAIFGEQQGLCSSTRFWAVAAELTGSVSDDGFQDFQSWLISQGRDFFMGAVKSPESLLELKARRAPGIDTAFEFEEFYYVCAHACEKKTGNNFWELSFV